MFCGVRHTQLTILLAVAAMASIQVPEPSLSMANERTSIERTYELTKYLEHQLKEIKDTYLSYLGPPFNDPDFSPPRPNSTALSLPSAATRLELWRGLENRARLAQNQRAYAVLLGAVRELARSTLCPYLQTSLLHFSTGLDGLLGSISGLMSTLGYALPPPPYSSPAAMAGGRAQYLRREAGGERARRPAPLVTQSLYEERGAGGAGASPGRVAREGREEAGRRDWTERKKERGRERGREGRRGAEASGAGGRGAGARHEDRGERGKRGRRREAESQEGASEEEDEEEAERWGGRRRLLSVPEEGETMENMSEPGVTLSLSGSTGFSQHNNNNNNNNNKDYNLYSYNLNYNPRARESEEESRAEERYASFPSLHVQRRATRSLFPPTLHPPLSLFYPFGPGGEGHAMLSEPIPLSLRRVGGGGPPPPPLPLTPLLASLSSSSSSLLSVHPALNDFSRKVEGFWVLRELQSWLWRSAKDFNRLKKRLRG